MTLAIGALSHEGVIIAADQAIVRNETISYEVKTDWGQGKNFSFAIAYSSSDAIPAKQLQDEIVYRLNNSDAGDMKAVQDVVRGAMAPWYHGFGVQNVPYTSFVLGVSFPMGGFQFGHHLLLCEPPQTFSEKLTNDDSHGFVAVGATEFPNPIRRLFGNSVGYKSRLFEIAYLMARAKKDLPYVGGRTNAIFIPHGNTHGPIEITPIDMEKAENIVSILEFCWQYTTATLLDSDALTVEGLTDQFADILQSRAKSLREFRFHSMQSEDIDEELQSTQ